jgi:O-antigen/teichoic acid export membrane protein
MVKYARSLLLRGGAALHNDAIFQRFLVNSGWLLSASGITTFLALLQNILVTRTLGVQQYGVLSIVVTFVAVVNRITSCRMGEFVVRYVSAALSSQQRTKAAAVIKVALLVEGVASCIAFGLICLLAPLGAHWFIRADEATQLILWYGVTILANLVAETTTGILQAFDEFRSQSLITTLTRISSLAAVAVAALIQPDLWGILTATLVGTLVSSLLFLRQALKATRGKLGSGWWKTPMTQLSGEWRAVASFIASTNLSASLSIVTKESEALWLGFFRSATEVGYYKLAMTVASLVFLPIGPMTQTIYPEITRNASLRQWQRFRTMLSKGSALAAAYVVMAGIVVGLASPYLIGVFFGASFTPAASALCVLLIGMGVTNILFWTRSALLALDRADYPVKINSGIAVLKVVGVFLILPSFGYIGNAALQSTLFILSSAVLAYKTYQLTSLSRDETQPRPISEPEAR